MYTLALTVPPIGDGPFEFEGAEALRTLASKVCRSLADHGFVVAAEPKIHTEISGIEIFFSAAIPTDLDSTLDLLAEAVDGMLPEFTLGALYQDSP